VLEQVLEQVREQPRERELVPVREEQLRHRNQLLR